MKKTLITLLLAASSLAMATTSTELTLSDAGKLSWNTADITQSLGNYMFTFTTLGEDVTLNDGDIIFSTGHLSGTNSLSVIYKNNQLHISNSTDTWASLAYTADTQYAFAFQEGTNGTYPCDAYLMNTSTLQIETKDLYNYGITNSSRGKMESGVSTGASVEFGKLYDMSDYALATTDNFKAAMTEAVAVPEPATATLSLLALAGLAARRRRKYALPRAQRAATRHLPIALSFSMGLMNGLPTRESGVGSLRCRGEAENRSPRGTPPVYA